ncbi:DUF4932 domain-containing protein [Aureibaculum sp. 2210JD6-5]|uniref:DUF4932 domain-containing protein n=1 Tax=Aureibaculum sp. 2210JD6-5 TaxID=3103957 RepID=UPI002AACEABF|nr:DUF4932 domain-containing protein [Aureibaculum sp. 2210JD6-5]MDY7396370.1 DUF4932 domain-containing protein [Aureibaculum sp. 2210JD6-5]
MRKLLILGIIATFLTCKTKEQSIDKFDVDFNENVETYFLAEILSINHRKKNKQWEEYKLKTCKEYQPIVAKALQDYGNLSNHSIAIETAQLNDTLGSFGYGNDLMMGILLEQPEFKLTEKPNKFTFSSTNLENLQKVQLEKIISDYLTILYEFYQSESIGDFYLKNNKFYQGAINEVRTHIPKGFTDAMEFYYGDNREKYIALVSPMMIWPIEDNEGRGIGATVEKENGKIVYEIMSPYVQVPVKSENNEYEQFGFDYEPRARTLTVHEFGHSFVNSELEPYKKQIESYSHLFTDSLKEKMESKGIQTWNVYVIESFVRLGEIRIAEIQNDPKRADFLRNYHIQQEHFIFIPQLEKKIIEFENDREKYPKWKDFIPELLEVFDESNADFVDEKMKGENMEDQVEK